MSVVVFFCYTTYAINSIENYVNTTIEELEEFTEKQNAANYSSSRSSSNRPKENRKQQWIENNSINTLEKRN